MFAQLSRNRLIKIAITFTCLLGFMLGSFSSLPKASTLAASSPMDETLASFPPTGHFVTHIFPSANRVTVAASGNLFAYGNADIYKSSDNGYLWTTLPLLENQKRGDLRVLEPSPDYLNDHTMFLGESTGYQALWISVDGGLTWALPADSITGPIWSIAFSPDYVSDQII